MLAAAKATRSGAVLDVGSPTAVRLTLVPAAEAGFDVAPDRTPAATAPAGVLRFEARAGTYQITLTDPGWLDLVQNGQALRPVAFSGVTDCEGARKTMRFALMSGPATLQISDARTRTLGIAISPAP